MATDKLINQSQGDDIINALDDIATGVGNLSYGEQTSADKVVAMTGYQKASTAESITQADTLNEAVGKLEKKVDDNATAINSKVSGPARSVPHAIAIYDDNTGKVLADSEHYIAEEYISSSSDIPTCMMVDDAIMATAAELAGMIGDKLDKTANAASAAKLNNGSTDYSVGSATKGVYFNNGVPAEMTYSVGTNVPSEAIFTDTTYSNGSGITINSSNQINHSNSVSEQSTASALKISYDAQGHITGSSALTKEDITTLGIPGSDTNTIACAYCNTAAATAAKTASCTDYALLDKSYLIVTIKTANSSASALTLNVNGKGAKSIYINGTASSSSNYTLPAGTYIVYYSTNYYFRTDGKITTTGMVDKNGNTTKYFKGDGTLADPPGTYSLPTASDSQLGGVKIGNNISNSSGVISLSGTNVTDALGYTPLQSHQTIKQDGVTGATVNRFGTCSTAADTAAKTVSITSGTFTLEAGARVSVKFTNANTAGTPTLNVNSKGAKNIFHKGAQITTGSNKSLLAGTVDFIYDGTQWHLIGNYIDTNTTYSSKSAASGGTDVSLCTTGEKYTWNSKAAGDHSHTLSMASDSGTEAISLSANTKYKLTAGGQTYIFKTPADNNTYPSAYCSTAAATAAKVATCSGYALLSKSYIHVIITTSNTSASALTLNINSKGAKPIYINGSASSSSNYTLPAGSYLVYYNGTNYYFRTDGKVTAAGIVDIGGNTGLYFKGDGTLATPYTHPSTAGNKHIPSGGSTGQVLVYGGSSGTAAWGELSSSELDSCKVLKQTGTWSTKTWSGLADQLYGTNVWTDGENIYYSSGSKQQVLNKSTSTWSDKTWYNLTSFYGSYTWTDGVNIYYSQGTNQKVISSSTSFVWNTKTWTGLTSFDGIDIWTDGANIYYSSGSNQYVLNKATSTWETKTWSGLTSFAGKNVWTDGANIYYSSGSNQYVLNKATSTWSTKTWTGLTSLYGSDVWTDGDNIYYSNGSPSTQYVLNKLNSTWSTKTWTGLDGPDGSDIWTDGDNIYANSGSNYYVLKKVIKSTKPQLRS